MPSLSVTNFCYLLFFNFCNLIEIVILKPNDPSISAIVTKKPNRGTEVEVILKRGYLFSNVSDSEILKISGTYWPESSQENAKGAIKLLHWCSSGDFSYDGPWVALFRDEPYPTCVTSFNSIERAILKGAEAVVIYLPRNKSILDQLKSPGSKRVNKPVVLLHSKELPLLSDLSYVDHDEGLNPEVPLDKTLNQDGHRDYYTISIFLGTLLVLSLISIAAILKFKGRWHKKEPCATQIAKRVLKSMETRKFNFTDHWFFTESCAVCLEEYIPGQEVRILPCRHEFHKSCVDGWLINRRTCPLCLSNILDRPNGNRDGYIYTSKQPPTHARAGASSGAVPGNYRRRYEFADESAETDHLGYIQQGFYRHSEEAGCVYAGYPSNTYEGISIAAPYEDSHPIGPATQAIVSNPPDQMVVSCNNPRTDEVDSASEEVGAPMCRSNFGFDRLVMRDRHRRFSCRRSAPSNSSPALYWGVGGLRSLRARRAILPEYSRLRIKLRQSHSEKNKNASSSLIVNNNTSSVGVLQQQQQQQQQQSSSPIASNLSQLKVLPQQHSHQRLFYTDGTDGSKHPDKQQVMPPHFVPIQVTSLSLKQSTTLTPAPIHPLTTATEATFTQTLPKCKKQLVSNNLNNSNTHNNSNNGGMLAPASTSNNDNATICYNKRRRPPCCSLDDEDEFIWRSSSTFSTVLALNSGSYRSAIKLGCINKLSELSNVHCNNNSENGNNNNNKSLVISNFGGCCRLAKLNHHKQGDKDNPACSSNNTACQLNTANPNKPCNMPDNSNNNNTVNCCEELNFQAVDNNINNTNNANNNKNKDHYHYCCFGDQRCSIASSSSHYHTLPGRRPRHSHHHRHHHHHLHQLHQPSNKQQHQQQQQKQQKHDVDNLKKDKHLCDQKETKGKHVSYNNVNNNNISNNNTSNNNTSTNNGNDQSSKTIMKSTRILNASELDSYKLNNNNNNNNNHNINNNNNNNVNNNVNINIGNSSKTYKGKEAGSILFDQSNSPFQSPLVAPVSSCSFVPMTTSSSLFHSLCHLSNATPPSKNSFVDANAHKAGLCNDNNVAINNNAGNIGYNMLPLSVRVVQRASHKNTASSLSRLPSLQPPSHPSPCQLPPCQPPPPPPSLLSTGSASTGKVKKPKLPTPQQFLTHQKASAREASNFPLSRSLGREVVGAFVEGCLDCQRGLEMAVEGATRRNNNSALLAGRYCKNTADPPPLTTDSPSAHMEF